MMGEPSYADAVSAHYTAGDLGDTILVSLRAAGLDPDALQVEALAPLDQFHTGGADATRALIRRAGLQPGMRVLDVGGGLGGPARLIAHEAGCTVTGRGSPRASASPTAWPSGAGARSRYRSRTARSTWSGRSTRR